MWKCIQCHETHEDSFDACWNCGTSKDGTTTSNFPAVIASDKGVDAIRSDHAPIAGNNPVSVKARPTGSLCWLTWLTLVALLAMSLGKNCLGQYVSTAIREGPDYLYGWPMVYLTRDDAFDGIAGFSSISFSALVTDIAVNALIIFGASLAVENWCRLQPNRPRFTVSLFLAATAWIATGLAMHRAEYGEIYYMSMLHDVFDTTLYIAIGLAWVALFTVTGRRFTRPTRHGRIAESPSL